MGWKSNIRSFVKDTEFIPRQSQFKVIHARINERIKYEGKGGN